MTKNKTFKATVVRDCILKTGTPVELQDAGHGAFFIIKANGRSTNPMGLWLNAMDFERTAAVLA